MPLPLAHGIIGASIVALAHERLEWRRVWPLLLLGAALAIAPDLDLLLIRLRVIDRGLYWHGGPSHSITAALLAGLAVSWGVAWWTGWRWSKAFCVYTLVTFSHGVLDAIIDKSETHGPLLLWPFSLRQFELGLFDPYYAFDPSHTRLMILGHALATSLRELLILGPYLLFVLWLRSRKTSG
jgi:hypothetical protein